MFDYKLEELPENVLEAFDTLRAFRVKNIKSFIQSDRIKLLEEVKTMARKGRFNGYELINIESFCDDIISKIKNN